MKYFLGIIIFILSYTHIYAEGFDVDLNSEAHFWVFADQHTQYDILLKFIKLSNQSLIIPPGDASIALMEVKDCVDSTYYNRWIEFSFDLQIYPVVSSCFNQCGWIR